MTSSNQKKILADYTREEMAQHFVNLLPYKIDQIFKWVSLGVDFSQMTNLSSQLRQELDNCFYAKTSQIIKQIKSNDQSFKLLYQMTDNEIVEGVYMPHSYANTLCVSTQAGCRMGCKFCASTIGGLNRNLTAGEIYSQVINANSRFDRVGNIVLMGSGEPLDNYENVIKFIKLVNCKQGLNIGQRSISLSTCGLVENIYKLADEGLCVNLSLSLHATTDETRASIMPIAKKYTIKQVMDAVKYYFKKTKRRIIIEYAMIKDVNLTIFDAKRLKELTKDMSAHINLIMLNHVKESSLLPCTPPQAQRFLKRLQQLNLSATIRKSSSTQVNAGCGQLRNLYSKQNPTSQKVIFLDVDGVICIQPEWRGGGLSDCFSQACCKNLKEIIDCTDAKIVVSSSWRLSNASFEFLKKQLQKYGIDTQNIDKTTDLTMDKTIATHYDLRWAEIKEYITTNNIKNYIIIDDYNLEKYDSQHLVKTDKLTGITSNLKELCIQKLQTQ